jgi:tRNA 2-thiouridine synthesizing protein A
MVQIDYAQSKERIPTTITKMGSEVLEIQEVGGFEWNIHIAIIN